MPNPIDGHKEPSLFSPCLPGNMMAVPSLILVSMWVPSSERVASAKNWCLNTLEPKKPLEMVSGMQWAPKLDDKPEMNMTWWWMPNRNNKTNNNMEPVSCSFDRFSSSGRLCVSWLGLGNITLPHMPADDGPATCARTGHIHHMSKSGCSEWHVSEDATSKSYKQIQTEWKIHYTLILI